MKKYDFNGHKIELNENTIIFEEDGIVLHPSRMTIDVTIVYEAKNGIDTDVIYEIPVKNMNFDGNLNTRVLNRLTDFEI